MVFLPEHFARHGHLSARVGKTAHQAFESDIRWYDCSGHDYCRMCGSHLTATERQRPQVEVPLGASEKYCGHCGPLRANAALVAGGGGNSAAGNRRIELQVKLSF
jgi:hypothetical protein